MIAEHPAESASVQAAISREYSNPEDDPQKVIVAIGSHALDFMTGLSFIDDINIAAQIRRAISEYIDRRLQDPSLKEQISRCENQTLNTIATVQEEFDELHTRHMDVPAIETLALEPHARHLGSCALCQVKVTRSAERNYKYDFFSYPDAE